MLKAFRTINNYVKQRKLRAKDKKFCSYLLEYPQIYLNTYLSNFALYRLSFNHEALSGICSNYLVHRFDLLGSGWVQVSHGMNCRELEGYRYDMGRSVEPDPKGQWLEDKINEPNLSESKRVWRLIDYNRLNLKAKKSKTEIYNPIDWHLDFKSGYRWSESTWYKDIRYGHKFGVDVKVPWELARMQHLPQLAFAYALAKLEKRGLNVTPEQRQSLDSLEPPKRYAREFRSQILDFISTNPPRFGVNWNCTMDVGIRVANWLTAYDLFKAFGAEFDSEFEQVIAWSVYEHGLHIVNNLEWSPDLRSNHYLSDIAGLLFVAVYLPCLPEIDAWLAFAVQELITEVESQFYPDGGNFEASTSYHRLSAEMVVYATALVLGLPEEKSRALKSYDCKLIKAKPTLKPAPLSFYPLPVKGKFNDFLICESPFPGWYFKRLEKMAEFTMHITKPNNHIPQIGDNDSGRFFKFQPTYKKMTVAQAKKRYLNLEGYEDLPDDALYWDEDFLDHRHLVAAINGLFDRDDFTAFAGDEYLETDLVRDIAGGITISSYKKIGEPTTAEKVHIKSDNRWEELHSELANMPEDQKQTIDIPLPDGAADDLKLYAYPNFGLYIYRSKRLYLAIRCGPVGQNGNGGHAHNDQLSIELNIDGKDIISDPGTYLYTPLPERRNEYRSVKAHFAPQVKDREPGNLNESLFKLGNAVSGECLYFGAEGFVGRHYGYGEAVWRFVEMANSNNSIRIQDMADLSFEVSNCDHKYSPAYGCIVNAK